MKSLFRLPTLLPFIVLLFSCSHPDKKSVNRDYPRANVNAEENNKSTPVTIFNEENLSTDYSDIQVSIGEVYLDKGTYFVDVKVETNRENYHIEIVGNLSDGKGSISGPRLDSFYGPGNFEHRYGFEKIEGLKPHLLLLSIYNPIDGNWNDLKYIYF